MPIWTDVKAINNLLLINASGDHLLINGSGDKLIIATANQVNVPVWTDVEQPTI